MSKPKLKIPTWLTIFLLIYALVASVYTVASATVNFTVKTPWIADLMAGPSSLHVEDVSFTFNITTNRYDTATLDIKNYDTTTLHTGMIYVYFYNVDNLQIAEGSVGTGNISPGVRIGDIKVELTWLSVYSAEDFERGKITLVEQS